MSQSGDHRLDELLLLRAVEGLDTADAVELEWRLAQAREADPLAFDEAAAYYWLAADRRETPLPAGVAERAEAALSGVPDTGPREPAAQASGGSAPGPASSRWAWTAAAAALVLAAAGWWPRLQPGSGATDPAEARERLLATAPDAVRVEWQNTDHPRGQKLDGGYVVWSDERQQGYMTFRGIPPNQPDEHQYQLWVFDAGRTEKYPVDGGVFDARNGRELVVPINNKLPIEHARMFAVTLEPPGGVVVSDRDPLLWIAQANGEGS